MDAIIHHWPTIVALVAGIFLGVVIDGEITRRSNQLLEVER